MPKFIHITPNEMMLKGLQLGEKLYNTGFRPKHAISIWRGGTTVGLFVDAYFRSRGLSINHTTIATESYTGIGQQSDVRVKGLEHVVRTVCREDGLLILDDVYESGNTIRAITETLHERARANAPERIMVGTIHRKPDKMAYTGADVRFLDDVPGDTWIDYPHELADMVTGDPSDPFIKEKDPRIWETIRQDRFEPTDESPDARYRYVSPDELMLDALKLGVNVFHDTSFHPHFIVALWPGGVSCGLPVHEVYKYKMAKSGQDRPVPDHISLNTMPSRLSYVNDVIGLDYLAEKVNSNHNVLIVDTTFKSGRLVNSALTRLKEVLRRNLDLKRVRVASLYWNPDDDATWTAQPLFRKPHYYIKKVCGEVVYPHAIHRLRNAREELRALDPAIYRVLFPAD